MARERVNREKFYRATVLLGLDVEPHEVDALSLMCAVVGFVAGGISSWSVLIAIGMDSYDSLPFAFSVAALAAVAAYALASHYPVAMARRMKLLSLGKSPETICYMVMSLNLVPSLERAVHFAAEHSEEPLASALRKVLWKVETRESASVDESFMDFAEEWSGDGEELKMALFSVRGAVSEKTKEGRTRVLEKASESALSGARRRIEEFASGLSGPTTILFALGILLPLVVGSMLPMMAIGTLDVGSFESGLQMGGDPMTTAVAAALLMDVAFPALAFAYAFTILGRRPGTSSPPEVPTPSTGMLAPTMLFFLFMIPAALLFSVGSEGNTLAGVTFGLGAVSISCGYWLVSTAAASRAYRKKIRAMESEFPDALFQLGRRIAEGIPLEAAFPAIGERMRGSEIGGLFVKIGAAIKTSGLSPERALFDDELGVLRDVGSRTVRASLRSVVAASEMDPQTAGKMMMDFSGYLRDLQKTAHDVKMQLAGVSENMRNTAALFAPLVMGVTVGLFALLSRTFADVGDGVGMMPLWMFAAIVGIYLMQMVIVISHFCSRLLHGEDGVELKWRAGTSLIVSWFVYAAAVSVAYVGFA
jgi:Flp pilus assembly protein TadB